MSKCNGYCGLDCTKCPAYIALKTDDNDLRIKTAKEWTVKFNAQFSPEMINCTGCKSAEKPQCGYCGMCPIRACGQKKNVEKCISCLDFEKCETRKDFEKLAKFDMKNMA